MSGPTLAAMAQQLLAYGIPLVALRLGQGLLPLTRAHGHGHAAGSVTHGSAGDLAEQLAALGVAVGPTAPYERAMAEDLQAVAVDESARLARLQLGGGGGDGMDEDGGGVGGKKDVGSRADQQQMQQQQQQRQQLESQQQKQREREREQVASEAEAAMQELGMEKGGGGGGLKRGGGGKQQQQFCDGDGDGDGDGEAQPDDSADTILLCTGETVEMGAMDDGPEYRGSTSGSGTPPFKGLQDKVRRGSPLGIVA